MTRCRPAFRRRLVAFFVVGLLAGSRPPAMAVPANPQGRAVVQPDGRGIALHLRGDEFFSWWETPEGYAVVKEPSDGFWTYARPVADRAEFRAVRGARVGASDPARLGLRPGALPDARALRGRVEERRKVLRDRTAAEAGAAATAAPASAAADGIPPPEEDSPEEPPVRVPVSGRTTVKNAVILACFSNHWDDALGTVNANHGRQSVAEYTDLFNEINHSADGAVGSVRDYYLEVSYGKLTLDSTVSAWVRLPREESYYHDNQSALAADAVAAADAAGFDFAPFDTDGDGWVDCLDIIHSGYGEESTGDSNHVWSVKGSMPSTVTLDGVRMRPYHTEPALRSSSGTDITRIGVICHETGHFFGLPDLYDYSGRTHGLGYWCEMAGGTWNGSGARPAHFSAWCKVFLGFADTVPIQSKDGFALPSVEDHPVVGVLRDGLAQGEYFLVENRARVGFDNDANIHPGLVIYHVDGKSKNNDLGTWPHPAVKIEEADGNDSLGSKVAQSQPGDVWSATSGLDGGFRDQTASTNTSAMLYQSGDYYVRTAGDALPTYNRLRGFSAAGEIMTFDAQTFRAVAPTQSALTNDFPVSWAACSEAVRYELQEGVRTTLTEVSDGAEDEGSTYETWKLGGGTERVETNLSHGGSTACFAMLSGRASVHMLTLRTPFKVGVGTAISFHFMSHISQGNGYLKCQISNDDGDTWKTLVSTNGYVDPWSPRSCGYAALSAAGIAAGDTCLLRFVSDIESGSGWSSFPKFGFALDDISVTGVEIEGHGGWATLDDGLTAPTYVVPARPEGVYAYRVRAHANGMWQAYGVLGETTVGGNHAPAFGDGPLAGPSAVVGADYSGSLASLGGDPDVNDTLVFSKQSGPAWLAVAADGTLSGMPAPADVGTNVFAVRLTDRAGSFDEAEIAIVVGVPASPLTTDLVAYLPFDADFLDYSGRNNHPVPGNDNARAAGLLGANGYVLTSAGHLSFGMAPDLHFSNSTAGNAASFSVSFWARSPAGSFSGSPPYVSNKDWASDDNTGWGLSAGPGTSGSGFFQVNFKESNANARNFDPVDPALTNGWRHFLVVFKRDGTRACTTYIDGQLADTRTLYAAGVNIDGAGLPVNIGQDGTGAGVRGIWAGALMDDFAFWRREITAAEAAAIHTAGTNGTAMVYAQTPPVVSDLSPDLALPYGASTGLSVTVVSATPPTYQWRLDGSPVAGATNRLCEVTNLGPAGARSLDVVVGNGYGTITSRLVVVTYGAQGPAAGPVVLQRPSGATVLKVSDVQLLANSSDPGDLALSVVGVSAASTNGGTVTLSGRWILYSPPAGNPAEDAFTFLIRNTAGAEASGIAVVRTGVAAAGEEPTANVAGMAVQASGMQVRFVGIPGRAYRVQYSPSLSPADWQPVGDVVIGTLGYAVFLHEPLPSGSTHFYRTVQPEP